MKSAGEATTCCGVKALTLTVIKAPVYLGQTTASCLHLIFVCSFLHYFPSCAPCLSLLSLSLESRWCWSLVNEYLGPLPHGEPDLLARFYGPFQSCPGLNTASCWPHGRNVVPCPSGEENRRRIGGRRGGGGGCLDLCQKGFTQATNICGHVEASGTGRKKKNAADFGVSESLFWHLACFVAKSETTKRCITDMGELPLIPLNSPLPLS